MEKLKQASLEQLENTLNPAPNQQVNKKQIGFKPLQKKKPMVSIQLDLSHEDQEADEKTTAEIKNDDKYQEDEKKQEFERKLRDRENRINY